MRFRDTRIDDDVLVVDGVTLHVGRPSGIVGCFASSMTRSCSCVICLVAPGNCAVCCTPSLNL